MLAIVRVFGALVKMLTIEIVQTYEHRFTVEIWIAAEENIVTRKSTRSTLKRRTTPRAGKTREAIIVTSPTWTSKGIDTTEIRSTYFCQILEDSRSRFRPQHVEKLLERFFPFRCDAAAPFYLRKNLSHYSITQLITFPFPTFHLFLLSA